MSFSESQLETWSNQGATASSANTYNSIKTCIDGVNWKSDLSYKIYLQGSYKNTTNIRGNSDVDVVVEIDAVFYSNKKELPIEQFKEYEEYHESGKYILADFKKTIVEQLNSYYGEANVNVGNRSIKVRGQNGRLDADVIPCAQYREYKSFWKHKTNDYVRGIVFWETKTNNKVVNFPELHFRNGADKNSDATNNYKPSIRIIKNMRSRMVENGLIDEDLSPSYFIECLLYNIPSMTYCHNNYFDIVVGILNFLNNTQEDDLKSFVCQNMQRCLFGASDQQWSTTDCLAFSSELIDFWNKG